MDKNKQIGTRLSLILYDLIIFLLIDALLFLIYRGAGSLSIKGALIQTIVAIGVIFGVRLSGKIYRQIWRYGGIQFRR